MSAQPADVLAVLEEVALSAEKAGALPVARTRWDAYHAVAELIEAANRVAYAFINEGGDHINGFELSVEEVRSLRAALARCGGR